MAWEKCAFCRKEFFRNKTDTACPHCDHTIKEQQKTWKCFECGNRNLEDGKFCVNCGTEKVQSGTDVSITVFCPECGFKCISTMNNCSGCGKNLQNSIETVKKKQRREKAKNFIFSLLDSIPEGQIRGPERINPEKIGRSLVGRKCPFCGSVTLGDGLCNSCRR